MISTRMEACEDKYLDRQYNKETKGGEAKGSLIIALNEQSMWMKAPVFAIPTPISPGRIGVLHVVFIIDHVHLI